MLDTLKNCILDTAEKLKTSGLKIVTAESCTGGGLCYWLTSVPESSGWVERGFVTYSNESKIEMLGVSPETLAVHGAVSQETAIEMAAGALSHSQADIAISITGIAGPDSDSSDKPVGTVWIGHASRQTRADAKLYNFQGDRQAVRLQAIISALKIINAG